MVMDSPGRANATPSQFEPAHPGRRPVRMPAESTAETDEQLMLAYAAGDAKAFDRLYQQHRGPLYRYILRQVKDPVASNDLYQQCWEKVIKGRHGYRSKSPFAAWLFRIARNTVIDYFRRAVPESDAGLADLPGEAAGPEALAQQQEAGQQLADAIDALPPEQREVLLLRLEAGLGLEAIAEITGVNAETCKSRLRYALGKLRQKVQQAGEVTGGQHARR
jgi:RNA polymerase sigma factor (sigma-70 family)